MNAILARLREPSTHAALAALFGLAAASSHPTVSALGQIGVILFGGAGVAVAEKGRNEG
ncbi:MAG: hypothetical protein HQL51_04000 [Magnetococcales bacterium]|nr:hypothetical protein [Magnetococcales bacterium]